MKNKFVEAKINLGWFGGSVPNSINKLLREEYSDYEVVNAIPIYVNPVRTILSFLVGIITLGFYVPYAGYAVILKKI